MQVRPFTLMKGVAMLRVTVELVPYGLEKAKKKIAIMEIWNDGSGDVAIGNYGFKISETADIKNEWKSGELKNFPRLGLNVYHLIFRILRKVLKNGKEV